MMTHRPFKCKPNCLVSVSIANLYLYLSKRDCLRFAFMDLLQQELNLIEELWNTHMIRPSGAETEWKLLFFFLELAG